MNIADGTYRVESDGMGGVKLGATVHMGKGYWVAEYGGVEINGTLSEQGIKDALNILDVEPMEHVGVWKDPDNILTYIDRSHHFINKQTAIDLAHHWKQLAIWDCANNTEIFVDALTLAETT
jgi:hypothetical protein